MIKHIPNALTCANLLCGCLGIMAALQGEPLQTASYMIYLAALFDFFDGFAARALKVSSPIGKELDSLADVVSFGVLPGMMMLCLMQQAEPPHWSLPTRYLALIIPVFSALRLAKFNIDTRQSDSFIGVPTPANALLISALPFVVAPDQTGLAAWLGQWANNYYVLAGITLLMSYLLVAELPLLALKFKGFHWASYKFQYILLGLSVILFLAFNFAAIPLIIFLYILLSVIKNFYK